MFAEKFDDFLKDGTFANKKKAAVADSGKEKIQEEFIEETGNVENSEYSRFRYPSDFRESFPDGDFSDYIELENDSLALADIILCDYPVSDDMLPAYYAFVASGILYIWNMRDKKDLNFKSLSSLALMAATNEREYDRAFMGIKERDKDNLAYAFYRAYKELDKDKKVALSLAIKLELAYDHTNTIPIRKKDLESGITENIDSILDRNGKEDMDAMEALLQTEPYD